MFLNIMDHTFHCFFKEGYDSFKKIVIKVQLHSYHILASKVSLIVIIISTSKGGY
jgi:hypothetical protein